MRIHKNKKMIFSIIALSCLIIIGLFSFKTKAEEKDYSQSNNSSSQSEAIISTISNESKIADTQTKEYTVEAYETLPDFPNEIGFKL